MAEVVEMILEEFGRDENLPQDPEAIVRGLFERLATARARVKEFETVIRKLPWKRVPGVAGHTCNFDAYHTLIDLLPDQSGEGEPIDG